MFLFQKLVRGNVLSHEKMVLFRKLVQRHVLTYAKMVFVQKLVHENVLSHEKKLFFKKLVPSHLHSCSKSYSYFHFPKHNISFLVFFTFFYFSVNLIQKDTFLRHKIPSWWRSCSLLLLLHRTDVERPFTTAFAGM